MIEDFGMDSMSVCIQLASYLLESWRPGVLYDTFWKDAVRILHSSKFMGV